jgi:hypothetical protein
MEPTKTVHRARVSSTYWGQVPERKIHAVHIVGDAQNGQHAPLVMTPDSTAEAGAGATGWAAGSQACMGIMPALHPKPTIIRK